MRREKIDLILLLFYPILASLISFLIKPNAFISVVLFLILPGLYLSIRGKKYVKRSFIFSLLSIPIMILIDYIAYKTGLWVVPYTVFPIKLFDLIPLEDLIWAFFLTYLTVIFYEYFLDEHISSRMWYPRFKFLLIIGLLMPSIILYLVFDTPGISDFKHFYLIFGTVLFLIPILIVLIKLPKLLAKLVRVGAYFFYVPFLYEITALKLSWWYFPRETTFLGWVRVFDESFPIEELVFWMMLTAMGTLTWFEYFDDDTK